MFKPKVEASPNDTILVKKAVKMLSARDCNSSDFYMELATKIHTWEPSAESAVSIGTYWYKQKKYKKAADFYKEGLTLTNDESEKAKRRYTNLLKLVAEMDDHKGSGFFSPETIMCEFPHDIKLRDRLINRYRKN